MSIKVIITKILKTLDIEAIKSVWQQPLSKILNGQKERREKYDF